jgi:VWFA-related protein
VRQRALCTFFFVSFAFAALCLTAQEQAPASSSTTPPSQTATQPAAAIPAPQSSSAEISSQEQPTTFKVNVNLVLVRVVVRDAAGKIVGNLKKGDFQLFDNRKPQVISKFAVESPQSEAVTATPAPAASGEAAPAPAFVAPQRFVAYLFDDMHLQWPDLQRVREAANRTLADMKPTDRLAIYTTSGQGMVDFTDDGIKLQQALLKLMPHPIGVQQSNPCPDISYYMADLMENKGDSQAIQAATQDALACRYQNDPRFLAQAEGDAKSTAMQQLSVGNQETLVALRTLKDMVRKTGSMPGQRMIVLVSPGFFNPENLQDESDVIDRAVRENVIVNTLDARGLYTVDPLGDISQSGPTSPSAAIVEQQYRLDSARTDENILAEIADGTGGSFFHNSNDFDTGFRRVGIAAPEYSYVLGFSPSTLKPDGHYHALKVSVKVPPHLSIQARRGYFAPKHQANPEEMAKQELEDAVFSQDEQHELPVALHTQFFKSSDEDAKLAVLVWVDLRKIRYVKVQGRNNNALTIVSALFDRNGNYVIGQQKKIEMRLKDETLQGNLGSSGITLKSSFDVKPGSYMVRLVVRDAAGQLSTENGAVEIP